jgi:hypothetical protein
MQRIHYRCRDFQCIYAFGDQPWIIDAVKSDLRYARLDCHVSGI